MSLKILIYTNSHLFAFPGVVPVHVPVVLRVQNLAAAPSHAVVVLSQSHPLTSHLVHARVHVQSKLKLKTKHTLEFFLTFLISFAQQIT